MRCKMEELHSELKHLTGREASQNRQPVIQINPSFCAIIGWNSIKEQRA